jgi:hypothetical protein
VITPAVPAAAVLRASLRGELLTLTHTGSEPLLDLRIAAIDTAGARYSAAAADGIAPGEELQLALDDFSPPVDLTAPPTRLEVTARDPWDRRYTFQLGLR